MANGEDHWPPQQDQPEQSVDPKDDLVDVKEDVHDDVVDQENPALLQFHGLPAPLTAAQLAEMAVMNPQAYALLAQQQVLAHNQYEQEQREKAGNLGMPGSEGLAMHQLPPQQQQPEQHALENPDFERDKKEKRKVANREAARRMRQRRADQLQHLSAGNNDLKTENVALQHQLSQLANHNRELMAENAALKQRILHIEQAIENGRLAEIAATENHTE